MASPDGPRLYELVARTCELDASRRRSFVEQECGADLGLRDRVLEIVSHREALGDFLEAPAATRLELLAAPGPPLPLHTKVGHYVLVRVLAAGGSGTVYEALQESPRRKVALKVMTIGLGSTGAAHRLREEAQILARLSHPGIAHVYEAGVHAHDGVQLPWLALEYVEGGHDLVSHARSARLGVRARIELMAQVCDAVHHGHEQGILHGDLKPSNLLVDAAGRPKVIDFGIARVLGAEADLGLAGTPAYMSPEQCEPGAARLDVRSDVYALGAVCYELLAERPARDLESLPLPEALDAVCTRLPARIESVAPRLRGDVASIVHKALAREREGRYASAAALADDLRRHLAHRPIEARSQGLLYVASRFARRAPAVTFLLAATVAISLAAALAGTRLAHQYDLKRQEADRQREVAQRQAYVASLAAASAALRAHDVAEARRQLDRAPEGLRGWEWRHLRGRLDDSLRTIRFEGRSVTAGDVSADGRRAAVSLAASGAATKGNAVAVVELATGASAFTLDTGERRAYCVALDATGDRLALGYVDGGLEIRDGATGNVRVGLEGHASMVNDVAFDAAGRRLASAGRDGTVRLWDTGSGAAVASYQVHADRVIAVDFDPAGERIATACRDGTVHIVEAATGRILLRLTGHEGSVEGLAWRPDGRRLATTCRDGTVRLWDTETGAILALRHDHTSSARSVAFAPDGATFATVSWDRTLRLWSGEDGSAQGWLQGHESSIFGVAYAPPLPVVVTFGGALKVWRARRREEVAVMYGHRDFAGSMAFSPNGRVLASISREGSLRLWDAAARRQTAELAIAPSTATRVSFFDDGPLLYLDGNGVHVCDLDERGTPKGAAVQVAPSCSVATPAPRGPQVALGGTDGTVTLVDTLTGQPIRTARAFDAQVVALAFDPNGEAIAAGSRTGEVAILDAVTLERRCVAPFQFGRIWSLAMAPDGKTLGIVTEAGGGLLLDTASLRLRASLVGHVDAIYAIAFHPDGTRIATGGKDNTVRIWDGRSGELMLVLHGPRFPVWAVAFSPDGRRLASSEGYWEGADSCIRLWEEFAETAD